MITANEQRLHLLYVLDHPIAGCGVLRLLRRWRKTVSARCVGLQFHRPPDQLAIEDFRSGATERRSSANPLRRLHKSLGQQSIANEGTDRLGGGVMPVCKTVILNGLQEILAYYDPQESRVV